MLKDIADSKRINSNIKALPTVVTSPVRGRRQDAASIGPLTSTVTSALFWPPHQQDNLKLPLQVHSLSVGQLAAAMSTCRCFMRGCVSALLFIACGLTATTLAFHYPCKYTGCSHKFEVQPASWCRTDAPACHAMSFRGAAYCHPMHQDSASAACHCHQASCISGCDCYSLLLHASDHCLSCRSKPCWTHTQASIMI